MKDFVYYTPTEVVSAVTAEQIIPLLKYNAGKVRFIMEAAAL